VEEWRQYARELEVMFGLAFAGYGIEGFRTGNPWEMGVCGLLAVVILAFGLARKSRVKRDETCDQ
jgi:hypothetical protein